MSNNQESHTIEVELEPILSATRLQENNAEPSRTRSRSRTRSGRDLEFADKDAEMLPKPTAPRARPEFEEDEDDVDDRPNVIPRNNPGVDDGFFPTNTNPDPDHINPNGAVPRRPPPWDRFPYAPGYDPNDPTTAQSIPDVNVYQQKKTLAQGMMDLALLSANANQLRYVLESYNRHPYYYTSLTFISISIIFQIAVGIGLILNSRYDVKDEKEICKANRINNFTVIGIFVVTIVNVFIASFGVANPPPDMQG